MTVTLCQRHQAGESTVRCLSQGHNSMVRVGFEPRPCRSQSRDFNRVADDIYVSQPRDI